MDNKAAWIEAWNSEGVDLLRSRFLKISGVRESLSIQSHLPGTGGVFDISSHLPDGYLLATTNERDDQRRWTRMGVHLLKCVRDAQGNLVDIMMIASLSEALGQGVGEHRNWLVDIGSGYIIYAGGWNRIVLRIVKNHLGCIVGIEKIAFGATDFQEWAKRLYDIRGGYLVVNDASGSPRTRVLQIRKDPSGNVSDIVSITPRGLDVRSILAIGDDYFIASTFDKIYVLKFAAKDGSGSFVEVAILQKPSGYFNGLVGLSSDYFITGSCAEDVDIDVLKVMRDASGSITGIESVCSYAGQRGASHVKLLPLCDRYVLLCMGDQSTHIVNMCVLRFKRDANGKIVGIGREWSMWKLKSLSATFRGLLHSVHDLGGGHILVSLVDKGNDGTIHIVHVDGQLDQ